MIAGVCAMLVCSSSAAIAGLDVGAAAKPSSASAPAATMRPKERRAPRADAVAVIRDISPLICKRPRDRGRRFPAHSIDPAPGWRAPGQADRSLASRFAFLLDKEPDMKTLYTEDFL